MAGAFDGIDLSNPCEVLPVLRSALYRMAAGESEVRVKYEEFDHRPCRRSRCPNSGAW